MERRMNRPRPWLAHYDPNVPGSLDYPTICVHDYLKIQTKRNPRRAAIIQGDQVTTYESLNKLTKGFAQQLITAGIKPGDRVGICLPNSLEFVVSFFAVLQAGGIVAAMNPIFPAAELEFQVNTAQVGVVITNAQKAPDFEEIDGKRLAIILVTVDNGEFAAALTGVWTENDIASMAAPVTMPEVHPQDAAVFQFSGGTTGTPKVAVGTHQNLVTNATQFRHWLVGLEDGKETFLIAIPLYHVYGLVLGLILGTAKGATLVFLEKLGDVDEMLRLIEQFNVSYFPAVPSIYHLINNHPTVKSGAYSLRTIKACISGSAPLLESTRLEFEKLTGGSLVEGYGLSEAPTATHCNPVLGEKKPGSIGLPLPDVDCRIVDLANDNDVAFGDEGELLISGPQVMSGYINAPEENRAALRDGWLRTGDIARMDTDGYFYISGRKKELIKVHGLQVWPNEVEKVISAHPAINECAVAGVADKASGERVKAWIVLQPGNCITLAEVKAYCQGKLAVYKIPSEIEIRAYLPKTAVGKLLRRELVREHNEQIEKEQGA